MVFMLSATSRLKYTRILLPELRTCRTVCSESGSDAAGGCIVTERQQILPEIEALLDRRVSGQVHFSDVFSEVAAPDDSVWWTRGDFDAELSVAFESGMEVDRQIPIGTRPWLAPYGLVLLDDLVLARQERVGAPGSVKNLWHPDASTEHGKTRQATLAVANYAPRDDEHTKGGQNGEDFYLGITTAGLEVYATPPRFLRGLLERGRLQALYRIPTNGHPEFDGEHEQFRSARIVRSRWHPEHLVPIAQGRGGAIDPASEAYIELKSIIGTDTREGHIAYVDKFGNIKLEERDLRRLGGMTVGQELGLHISNNGDTHELPVVVASDLKTAPLNQLAVYENCSDKREPNGGVGFVELIARVNGNPSTSEKTAAYQLLRSIPDLDFDTAEVKLVA